MDRVSHTEHKLTSQIGGNGLSLAVTIADAVYHRAFALPRLCRQRAEFFQQTLRRQHGNIHQAFQFWASEAMVIVDFAALNSFQQALEMVQHMAVMRAEGGAVGTIVLARVRFAAHSREHHASLPEHVFNRGNE